MKRKQSVLTPAEISARVVERIQQMTPEEALAYLEYREPGIPETDMNGELAAYYREERERREVKKSAA